MSSSRSGNSEQPAAATAASGRTSPFLQSSSESAERHRGRLSSFSSSAAASSTAAMCYTEKYKNYTAQVCVCVRVGGRVGGSEHCERLAGNLFCFCYSWTGCIFTFMNEAGRGGRGVCGGG